MFKYEMHLHTAACSACARSTSQEHIRRLCDIGYAGAVITNHFYHGNTAVDRNLPWVDFVKAYRDDYLAARSLGEKFGIDIIFGIEEVCIEQSCTRGKEALIYGLEPEDLMEEPYFIHMELSEMSDFVRSKGGFIACAHPFRARSYIPNPDREPNPALFDGIEVYNCGNSPEENRKAVEFAAKCGLAPIAGGDVHIADSLGSAGLAFEKRITNGAELVSALKLRDYKLIVDGEILEK